MGQIVKKWVVVIHPGTCDEREEAEFVDYSRARLFASRFSEDEGATTDVMRRLPDGTLTTEF